MPETNLDWKHELSYRTHEAVRIPSTMVLFRQLAHECCHDEMLWWEKLGSRQRQRSEYADYLRGCSKFHRYRDEVAGAPGDPGEWDWVYFAPTFTVFDKNGNVVPYGFPDGHAVPGGFWGWMPKRLRLPENYDERFAHHLPGGEEDPDDDLVFLKDSVPSMAEKVTMLALLHDRYVQG
ncbi:MAG: hypothetical protein IID42_05550 [Planctomycetes bacterium]|nr:hypothetical protein [Planctomycetota bacterium]